MKAKLKNGIALSLIVQVLLVQWLNAYPAMVERYYSLGIYPIISKFLRLLFGWIPFSVGDLFYILMIVLALRYLIIYRKNIKKRFWAFLRNVIMIIAIAHFIFQIFWGLNYHRQPLSETLGLSQSHGDQELVEFAERLIEKSNQLHLQITQDSSQIVRVPYNRKEIFAKTQEAYQNLETQFPMFAYRNTSIKTSLLSTPLTYMGYGGYLNPFTQEAQVNGKLPLVRFPVVSGHEIGHQVGYSAENETNFIGFLATVHHQDPYFKYSAYTYALSYCLSDIRRKDNELFTRLYAKVNSGIQKNYQEIAAFWAGYENPTEPIFKAIFNSFLKANNQAEGIQSYNAVVSLLVTYYQKHPLD